MRITVSTVDDIPDRPALKAMLREYLGPMLDRLEAIGGPRLSLDTYDAHVWDDLHTYLPPQGAVCLAHDETGHLAGCGFLKRIGATEGEMKRLYVRPAYRGQGLGQKLVAARIDAARALGLTDLYTDTIRGNDSMLKLYRSFGFDFIPRYAKNANPEEFAPWLVYLHKSLSD